MTTHGQMRAKLIKAVEAQSPAQTAEVLADLIKESESQARRILALENEALTERINRLEQRH